MALSRSARNRRGRRQRTNNSPSRTTLTIRNRRGRATGSRPSGSLRNFGSNYKTKELKAADLARSSRYATSEYKSDGGPDNLKNKPTESAGGSNQTKSTTTSAADSKKPTAKQAQKADFNKTYQEARRKALKIKDAQKRKIALEGVAQMGMEFHKKYYNKK